MARLLGEARVSILPDGTRFKPDTEAAVKKATEGITGKIPLVLNNKDLEAKAQAAAKAISDSTKISIKASADTKELDAQMAELAARSEALQKSLGSLKVSDPNMQAFLKGITKQASDLRNSLDKIGDSDGIQKASSSLDRMVTASDKVRAALGKTTFAEEEIATAAKDTAVKVATAAASQESAYGKASTAAKGFADEVRKSQDLNDNVTLKVKLDQTLSDAEMANLRIKLDRLNTDIKLGLNEKDAEVEAITLREKLSAILSDIRVKVHLDDTSVKSVLASIGGRFTKDIESAGGTAGGGFGSSFIGGLGKSALMQNPGITAAVIAGLAALPAAVGVVGVLGGIALGAGIMIGAETMIKAQLKTLTTDIKNQTTLINAKGTSPAVASAAKQALASDQAQVTVLNQQLSAFQRVNDAVKNLKNSFLNFAIVASKPLIAPFANALNDLSNQLKGPLATGFTGLFKAVGPLVKPVEESLLEIVKGILPGLTDMLNKARGPLTSLFLGFGKIVGVKIGQWFRDATPYIAASSKYFLALVSALGSVVSWLIKFGGESAKAFGGSQFKGFGGLLTQIGNDLLKLVIPAFEGWTGVMAPVAKLLLIIVVPVLNLLAACPPLTKALAGMAAAWLLVSKAVTLSAVAMKIFGVSTETILVAAPWIALATAIAIAAILIIKNWGPISSFFVKLWKIIWSGAIGPMINFFTNSVPHAFGVTINWLKKNWPLLIGIIGGPFAEIAGIVIKYHDQIFSVIKSTWGRIENVITGVMKPILSITEDIWGQIYKVIKGALEIIATITRIEVLIVVGLVGEAWRGIKNLTGMVWPWIYNTIKDTWGHIENATTGIVKPMVNWVASAWGVLKNVTGAAYNWLFAEIKGAWGHIENITTGIVKPMVSWVESAWNVLKSATNAAYVWLFNTIKGAWGRIENVTTGIIKPMVNWIESAWGVLKNATNNAFKLIYTYIFDPLQKAYNWIAHNFVSGVESAFRGLLNTVTTIWKGLKAAVGAPINFVIKDVWNPFAKFVNAGLSIFNIKTRLPAGNPIAFAKGGKVPGFAPGVDSVHAMLSPGEFVLRPQAVAAIGTENLHRMNKMSKGYANGGDVVSDIEKWNGHRYVWGGGANPTTGWDCSSFVNYIVGHDFKLNLPGGGSWAQMTNNGSAHGPVAASYNNWNYGHGVPWSGAKKGDLAIENNGAHIGFIIQDNTQKSSNDTLMGFAARSTATGTGYENFFPSAFHLERFADDRGFGSEVFDNTIGAVLKAAASVALNGIEGLANGALNHIPGGGVIPPLAKNVIDDVINAAKAKLEGNQSNFQFNNPAATGPAGVGTSAGEIANGKQIYEYLLANLFGGHKIAAAGATASIWGECVTLDHVILTKRGFLKHDEVQAGDETIGYNQETGRSEWTKIQRVMHYNQMPVVKHGNQYWDSTCTPNHSWLVQEIGREHYYTDDDLRRRAERTTVGPVEFKEQRHITKNDRIVLSFEADTGSGLPITDKEAAFLGWLAGDGTVHYGPRNALNVTIAQGKAANFSVIEACVPEGTTHSVRAGAKAHHLDRHTWYIPAAYARDLLSRAGNPKTEASRQVREMSSSQRKAWLEAMIAAEGTVRGNNTAIYQSLNRNADIAEAIELAVYLEGNRASRSHIREDEVAIGVTAPYVGGYKRRSFSEDAGIADVWCVTTELGSWTARNESGIFVTSNSTWNPFAQGTGGRGLIGWTPPSTISNADFAGGMRTQLPAILKFVVNSGDEGAIAQMFNASSVTQAANLWGRDVERFGINDVHTTGIQLATSFMKDGGMIPAGVFDSGGTLMPGPNLAYNLTGAPERLNRQGGSSGGNTVTLEVASGGTSEFEAFMLTMMRRFVRVKGHGNVQRALGRPGA